MPYIKPHLRQHLQPITDSFKIISKETVCGDLNYLFTMAIIKYLQEKGLSYQTLSDCTSALDNCKLELYRRVGGILEDKKIKQNGDVYPETFDI